MFSSLSKFTLAKALITKDSPIYVQFYVTARCNLTCKQCNIIYANSDVRECSIDEIKIIADNFAKLGVAMVLLTGGEPFVRSDLPEIIHAFEERGVHVRMQTNGFADEEQIQAAIEAGGKDISISLDTLTPALQDTINGGFPGTWSRAVRSMALFTKHLPSKDGFASIGCVLQPQNLDDVEGVIKFGTEIGWFTSLVPIHTTSRAKPMNFRSYDTKLQFDPIDYPRVDAVIERVRAMQKNNYLLYDSEQYLDDIKRFVKNESTGWRDRNNGVCDSPNLYFAVLPNGDFAPCCDHRLKSGISTFDPEFPKIFREKTFRKSVFEITSNCSGCMYGSYPEMTISMRFISAALKRAQLFVMPKPKNNWPISFEAMENIALKFRTTERTFTENVI